MPSLQRVAISKTLSSHCEVYRRKVCNMCVKCLGGHRGKHWKWKDKSFEVFQEKFIGRGIFPKSCFIIILNDYPVNYIFFL